MKPANLLEIWRLLFQQARIAAWPGPWLRSFGFLSGFWSRVSALGELLLFWSGELFYMDCRETGGRMTAWENESFWKCSFVLYLCSSTAPLLQEASILFLLSPWTGIRQRLRHSMAWPSGSLRCPSVPEGLELLVFEQGIGLQGNGMFWRHVRCSDGPVPHKQAISYNCQG